MARPKAEVPVGQNPEKKLKMRQEIGPLTKEKINGLPSKATSYPVPEGRVRCLYLQVTPAGKKSWVLRYRFKGMQKTHTLGKWPEMTVDDAGKAAIQALNGITQGDDPNQVRKEQVVEAKRDADSRRTVNDLIDKFISDHIEVVDKNSTQIEYKRLIKKHIRDGLGKLALSEVGTKEISEFLTPISKSTPIQCNRIRSMLITMFSRAEEWGYRPLGTNPVVPIKKRNGENKRSRRLLNNELHELGKTLLSSNESEMSIIAIKLYLLTGMRKAELIGDKTRGIEGLTWSRVNIDKRQLLVNTKSKKGKPTNRIVYCCYEVIKLLKSITKTKGNPFVIVGKNKNESLVGIQNVWERIRVEAGFARKDEPDPNDPRIHDLRRTFSSVGSDLGWKEYMGELLGHAEGDVTDIYTRTDPAILLQIAEEVGSRIVALMAGAEEPTGAKAKPRVRRAGEPPVPRKAGRTATKAGK